MISADQALQIVLDNAIELGVESLNLHSSIGRVLAEDIIADRDFPPFDRVSMDGIAINYKTYREGQRKFVVESIGPAGAPTVKLEDPQKCIEIMTGASLPVGTDTVIRFEDLSEVDTSFIINEKVKEGQNVHARAKDYKLGTTLINKGNRIKAIDINILATVGMSSVLVTKLPRVAVISSGDELVNVDEAPKDYQIRKSNVHMLKAGLQLLGIQADDFHFIDKSKAILQEMKKIIKEYDVILMSGGVSKGKFDFIPSVLDQLGFEKLFHKVAQRPGKPFWFGRKSNNIVFAFPGNPVSTLACFCKYFKPWIRMIEGDINFNKRIKVRLAEDVIFKPSLTFFAQAKIKYSDTGSTLATIYHGHGSGDMVSPSYMDGFVELLPGKEVYKAGEVFNFLPYK